MANERVDEMNSFKYESLDFDYPTFRLLRLCAGSGLDIECELIQASFVSDDIIPYEALSYAWGGTEMSATVYIDGHTLAVTENLYLALRYLRSTHEDRFLWVDAICINQNNYQERGHQVKQMGNIYSQADRVLFWLGPPTDDTDALMDSLKQLEEESAKLACKHWGLRDHRWTELWASLQLGLMSQHWNLATRQRNGLNTLLDRPWFNRVWILQEVANAKRALVCSGKKSLSARFFALVPVLLDIQPKRHCQAVLDIMPGPSRKDSWWGQKQDLYTLLLKFSDSKASDPRDMIFALLGIASDAREMQLLRADYGKTVRQVLQEAILVLFGLSEYPCRSFRDFLRNFRDMNVASLTRLANSSDSHSVAELLDQRKNEIWLPKEVFIAAAGNVEHGAEVMRLLLGRCELVPEDDEISQAAAENEGCGAEVLRLFFERRGSSTVGANVFRLAAQNTGCGAKLVEVVCRKQMPTNNDVRSLLREAVKNTEYGTQMVDFLLRQRREHTLEAATGCEEEVLLFVLQRLDGDLELTQGLVDAAVHNKSCGPETMKILLQQQKERIRIDLHDVIKEMNTHTSSVAQVTALVLESGTIDFDVHVHLVEEFARFTTPTCMELLLQQRGDEVIVTDKVVNAASHRSGGEIMRKLLEYRAQGFVISPNLIIQVAIGFGAEIMELFLQHRGNDVKITEEIVKTVLQKTRLRGVDSIPVLLRHAGHKFRFTEDLTIAAASNGDCAFRAMETLFEAREYNIDITEGVLKAAAGNNGNGWEATSFLLEQTGKTNKITEEVVKAAVGNTSYARDILELLITHKAENFLITEGVIVKALQNRYGGVDLVQFLLEAEMDSFVITEGLVEELVRSFRPTLAALLIKERGNGVVVTERVVKAAYANRWCGQEVRDLLLEHQRMNPKPPASSDPLKQWWKRGAS
jgi:hypothetical protein